MAQSLDSLASYLKEKPIFLEALIKDGLSTEQICLLDYEGCYSYEYTASFETLKGTQPPPIEAFHRSLTESFISEEV